MITYNQALEITQKSKSFYVRTEKITTAYGNTYTISFFDYLMATLEDFEAFNSFELRGLAFIHIPKLEGTDYIPFLSIPKFFNINENKHTYLSDLNNLEIIDISLKEDGSLVQPIQFPDGDIIWKSKSGMSNKQSKMANDFYNDPANISFKKYIQNNIEEDFLFFELTSPDNQIVVKYNETNLKLIMKRNRFTGITTFPISMNSHLEEQLNIKYTPSFKLPKILLKFEEQWYLDFFNNHSDSIFNSFDSFLAAINNKITSEHSKEYLLSTKNKITYLEFLILSRNFISNEEGFIITFSNLKRVKLKNASYLHIHKTLEFLEQENKIIKLIIDEKIDDAKSFLLQEDFRLEKILKIEELISNYFDNTIEKAVKLRFKYFNSYNNNIKNDNGDIIPTVNKARFSKENSKKKEFHLVMKTIKLPFKADFRTAMTNILKKEIKFSTRKLNLAISFLKEISN